MLNIISYWQSYFKPSERELPTRRFDLDWLRILAFGLLIFYHCGMLYVADWNYHIKSRYLSESLKSVMLFINPWRMPILWIISGIAIRFILAKVSVKHFLFQRSYRLLLPLLFGILVIVPPQLYYEMTNNGDLSLSYWQFYRQFFQLENPVFDNYSPGIYPHIDVNHLWYLRELWQFSLLLVSLSPILNTHVVDKVTNWLARSNGVCAIFLIFIPIIAIQFFFHEETRKPLGFLFLCYGYLLGWQPLVWEKLKSNGLKLALCGSFLYITLIVFYNLVWIQSLEQLSLLNWIIGNAIYSADQVIWVLAILGLSYRFLNKKSKLLSYFSEAVYPYYILHQTLIIIFAYELSRFRLGGVLEPLLIITLTLVGCALLFELIKRVTILRPLLYAPINPRTRHSVMYLQQYPFTSQQSTGESNGHLIGNKCQR